MQLFRFPVLEYEVIDGDTVRCIVDQGYDNRKKIDVRITGINTPEKRGAEKIAGIPVREVVIHVLAELEEKGIQLVVRSDDWGKYARRCLGDIIWEDSEGNEHGLGPWVLEHGMGRPYEGGSRREFTEDECHAIRLRCESWLG